MNILAKSIEEIQKKQQGKIMLRSTFKKTKKILMGAAIAAMLTTTANASSAFALQVKKIGAFSDGSYQVAFNKSINGTCSHYGFKFRVGDKNDEKMFKLLVLAKNLNQEVDILYKKSSTPGTDVNDGCTTSNMAIIQGVIMK